DGAGRDRVLVVAVLRDARAGVDVRIAEELARLRRAVDLALRNVVAHAVGLVVGEPERLVLRVEVHPDRIADAGRVDLAARAVLLHADDAADADLRVERELRTRGHVERLAERD